MSVHITLAAAHAGLQRIANRFPQDHTPAPDGSAQGCKYADIVNSVVTPVCIVGQFIADLGFLGAIVRFDVEDDGSLFLINQDGSCTPDGQFYANLRNAGVTFDEDAQRYLRAVQSKQDEGATWPNAVRNGAVEFAVEEGERHAKQVRQALGLW